MPCFYAVLQVDRSAFEHEIRSAYRKRALATHPDKGGSSENFRFVVAAFETLIDAGRRSAYDEKQRFAGRQKKRKADAGQSASVVESTPSSGTTCPTGTATNPSVNADPNVWSLFRELCDMRKLAVHARLKTLTEDALNGLADFLEMPCSGPEEVPNELVQVSRTCSDDFECCSDAGSEDASSASDDAQLLALCNTLGDESDEEVSEQKEESTDCGPKAVEASFPREGGGRSAKTPFKGIHRNVSAGKYYGYHACVGFAGIMVFTHSSMDLEVVIDMHISLVRLRQLVRESMGVGMSFRQALEQAMSAVDEERIRAEVQPLKLRFRCKSPSSAKHKIVYNLDDVAKAQSAIVLNEDRDRRRKEAEEIRERKRQEKQARALMRQRRQQEREARRKAKATAAETKKNKLEEKKEGSLQAKRKWLLAQVFAQLERLREVKKKILIKKWGMLPDGVQPSSFQSENDSVRAQLALSDGRLQQGPFRHDVEEAYKDLVAAQEIQRVYGDAAACLELESRDAEAMTEFFVNQL
eukprot:TRINITY_DN51111_c0_g1_i1.p1 TRINITY_DN51111_c0_g1~~TRINITY_DN51111_c0_g1_i1.p1  ORF type:complete len:526 (-),score=70.68 TRINITY_DN51111_c0_g1_i1:88-1665(-)